MQKYEVGPIPDSSPMPHDGPPASTIEPGVRPRGADDSLGGLIVHVAGEHLGRWEEGLAFLADGRLVVASEGAGGGAKLFVVPPR